MDIKLGTVVDILANGGVKITLDGEDAPRQKELNKLDAGKPTVGDRVGLGKQGEDYIIIGVLKPLVDEEETGQVYNWDMHVLVDVIEQSEYIDKHGSKTMVLNPFYNADQTSTSGGYTYFSWDPTGNGYKVSSVDYGYTSIYKGVGDNYTIMKVMGTMSYTETKRIVHVSKKGKGALIKRVTSKIRDAYPDGGEQNGYWYEFKG